MWYYVPISVHLILGQNTDNKQYEAVSGVHLIQYESPQVINKSYVVTICHSLKHLKGDIEIIINSKYLNSEDEVKWYECKLISEVKLSDESVPLNQVLQSFKQEQFLFFPNDIHGGNLSDIRLLVALPCNILLHELIGLENYEPFEICRSMNGEHLSLRTYPFNQSNSILFSDFISNGIISYTCYDEESHIIYLSDIRFMDNMLGGIANCKKGSMGLILGNFRKCEGQGNLTVVISWDIIRKYIGGDIDTQKFGKQIISDGFNESVLPITLRGGKSQTWGSCVYFNTTTIITNYHVIKEFIEDPINTHCFIHLSSDKYIKLDSKDIIFTRYKSLDLSFIELSEINVKILSENRRPVNFCTSFCTGDTVKSKSFGLFFNKDSTTPLESKGVISSILSLPFNELEQVNIPCMMVTSASCWNGSSGGGIFDSSGRFVGLICSNAVVQVPKLGFSPKELEIIPDFSMCLPINIIEECYTYIKEKLSKPLNPKIEKLWLLNNYHKDIIIRQVKL